MGGIAHSSGHRPRLLPPLLEQQLQQQHLHLHLLLQGP
jgi:hypothetical protein